MTSQTEDERPTGAPGRGPGASADGGETAVLLPSENPALMDALKDAKASASDATSSAMTPTAAAAEATAVPPPRWEEFEKALAGITKILVLTHDNPDPDAMASAIGLYTVLTKRFGIETFIGHGGHIGRAENKAMVRNLDLPIYSLPLLGDLSNFDGIVLVDTQTEARYHSLPAGIVPLAVFDHHPVIAPDGKPAGRFVEIRPEVGASATIIGKYLVESRVPIPSSVATALMYGIRSDTGNFQRHISQWDLDVHQALFPLMDAKRLGDIESPPLPREYYIDLRRGLDNATIHGRAVVVDLGELENPDMIALVADLLLRLDTCEWVMAFGFREKQMRISLRTIDPDGDAGRVVRKTIKKMGSGGGHGEMAAAQIPLTAACADVQYDILSKELVANFLQQINESEHGQPLCRPRQKGLRTPTSRTGGGGV